MAKNVPLSVRVSEDDAEFIARLELAGAATPSDKVRALLTEARRRHERFRDYAGCLAMLEEMLQPTLHGIREAEHAEGVHSELVARVAAWLPDLVAFLLTGIGAGAEEGDRERLRAFEAGLADRVFRLIEAVLRMGVTRTCRGYDPTVIADRCDAIVELAGLVGRQREENTHG